MHPVLLIVNPKANRGLANRRMILIDKALKAAGVLYDRVETEGRGHAVTLAQQAYADGYATVVAVGGDGTVSEVVNGLMAASAAAESDPEHAHGFRCSSPPALALFPGGTGNDFAAEAGFAVADETIAARIAAGHSRAIDVGLASITTQGAVTTRYFNNSLGIGLEAATVIEAEKIAHLKLKGVMLYAAAAISAVLRLQPAEMEVCYQGSGDEIGKVSGPMLMVTVGNSRRTGGGFYLTPHAKLDDGLLDVGVAHAISKLRFFLLLPKALSGDHVHEAAFVMQKCRRICVTAAHGVPVHADGELLSVHAQQVEIELLARRLKLVA